MSTEIAGRVTITWPEPNDRGLPSWRMAVHDADTGEQILDIFKLSVVIGNDQSWETGPVIVELTRIVDFHGRPLGNQPIGSDHYTEAFLRHQRDNTSENYDGPMVRTAVFRYLVSAMISLSEASR